ncbi:YceD family protein [Paenibacillus jiagnxiensis]|uniref:YceD family protein n=1 Tax=Paenibacillus jiagnxiensis TaxID=3228926 RepID=UPI0033BC9DA5
MHLHFRKVAMNDGPVLIRESLNVEPLITHRKDITSVSPLTADLAAVSEGEGRIDVSGTLAAELDTLCSRCLTPVHEHMNIPFSERFEQGQEQPDAEDEDMESIMIEGESFDTVPYCEESFLLHLPFAPLCRPDCKGLCPTCGQNWNEGSCSCNNERIDPRLAGLKDFFKK